MKTKSLLLWALSCLPMAMIAQDGGGEFQFTNTECLSNEDRALIFKDIDKNRKELLAEGKLSPINSKVHPLFIWPVKKSASAPYHEVWSISNYVDHNPAYPNQLQDWNCGQRTYDTNTGYNHAGIDIFTWPFGWLQMDNNEAEIVAAADGVIINKYNGRYDRNCNFNNQFWNAVYLQHVDGSVSWYGHMKNNSLTTKAVGETVSAGEYLGIVGSSGNSTGPHLHFEVYDVSSNLVETYDGPCNNWPSSTESWWANQKPYNNPKINAVLTHSSPVVLNNGCGVQETTNIENNFAEGNRVLAYLYLSDIPAGTNVNMQLIRPDNTVAYNNNFTISTFYSASYWYYDFGPAYFNQYGNWKTKWTVGTLSETHTFNYSTLASTINQDINNSKIMVVNPVKDDVLKLIVLDKNLVGKKAKIELISVEGKLITSVEKNLEATTDIPVKLQKANYLVQITTDQYSTRLKVLK